MTDSADWDIVVVGGANIDYMVRGCKLPTPGDAVEFGHRGIIKLHLL